MRRFSQLAIPYAVWVALMILLPMLLILLYAFTTQGNDIVNFSFTLDHFIRFFTDQDFLLILWRSLVIAFKTTIICVLLGYPIAYFIARSSDKVRNILVLVITLPMWINMLVRTYAWIGILSDGGILQNILSFLGFGEPELLYTEGAVLLGMVYNYVPYMILPLYTSMTKIDQSLVEAAQDLGASTTKTLLRVLIPMSVPGISTGITMVFVPAVSTFVISRMLGGGSNLLIGDLIEMQFLGNSYNLNVGSAMSLVLMIIVLLCMSFTSSFDEDEMEGVS